MKRKLPLRQSTKPNSVRLSQPDTNTGADTMVDPKTERTARAICRVEAQRYADRLQVEAWINLNWPAFVPHARAAMECNAQGNPNT